MTGRLKRKLNDLGVDTSSSKANENFCLIGTPLPPLEKSKDTGEFVPLWKQEVRDEKGRRRLHGAFIGGWSAGYFNSVGTKEGWAPSTFVSSRADRAKKQQARPEDFMDEEDLAELREGRKLVDENEEMEFGGTEVEMRQRAGVDTEEDSMAGALATALAPAPQDSVGAQILRKMGWRMGHGIGPRITWLQRRAQDREVLGGETQDMVEGEDEEAKKHMYPRRDTPLLNVTRKGNAHGLGYTPGMGLSASLGGDSGTARKGTTISAGFGLGALNDADEDDLDVYDGSTRPIAARRLAYDTADDDETIIMGLSHQSRRDAHNRGAKDTTSQTQTFRDGRPVLRGFVLSDKPVSDDRWFPLPEISPGWKPNPKRVWEADKNKENQVPAATAPGPPKSHAEWKASLLSADKRGSMLGETPLPSKPRSVFEFMSEKGRERIEKAKEALQGRAGGYEPEESSRAAPLPGEIEIAELHPSIAKAALSGFQPFTAEPSKQARYTTFLTFASSASPDRKLSLGPLPGQSVDEFNKELADYAKAATVFKPLSGAMASRFQSAAIVESGPKVVEGLHTPDTSTPPEQAEDAQAKDKEEKKEEDPRMAAVKHGMYGPLPREVKPWRPDHLLCKRFGVKPPEVDMDASEEQLPAGSAQSAAASGAGASGTQTPMAITDGKAAATESSTEGGYTGPRSLANIGLGEDDGQGRDTLTYQRPGMDVFKAIFASDDEESDDEDEPSKTASATPAEALAVPQEKASAHPSAAEPTSATSTPVQGDPAASENQSVDLATFKPTFVPRADREARKDKDKSKDKEREKKDKEKKKKHVKSLVSFDTEEGAEGLQVVPKREKHKDKSGERKAKKRKEKKEAEDDDSMWVEAPAPEVVRGLEIKSLPPVAASDGQTEHAAIETGATQQRGRKRAIDFM